MITNEKEQPEQQEFEQDTLYNKNGGKQATEFFSNEPGVPSKVKGKIYKGTTFTRGNKEDKTKIQDLVVSNLHHISFTFLIW